MFGKGSKNNRSSKSANVNLRFNLLTILTYVVGIILIAQLFNLQIVHGAEYREQSNTRLTRESTLEAARGSILDSTGTPLVTSKMEFSLEMYKTKVDTDTLNNSILNMINVLEKYGCSYTDNFPIKIDPFEYTISDDALANWKKQNKFDENISAEDAFYKFKDKYEIKNTDVNEIRKIIAIRYLISEEGYSSTKSVEIATNIPREAVAEFSESSDKFAGINIVVEPVRDYPYGELASHILGYVGKISSDEYATRKEYYTSNDIIGKTGIENIFEEYLKGKNGTRQIDMDVDGTTTAEYISDEAIAGSDVMLTIDANLQKVTEDALQADIEKIKDGGFGQKSNAKGGACVVMNVNTGDVLAMASYPNFNPADFVGGISTDAWNNYMNNDEKPLVNKAVQNSYSPGSTFKMITAIAGLETGAITTKTLINDTGVYTKYGVRMNCWYYTDYHRGHGPLNVSQAIEKSCNFFFYETGDRVGIDKLAEFARYFGLGVKTGIELPSETAGILADRDSKKELHPESPNWNPGDTLNAAIGQGDNQFSPLQMAKYISMLANGGHNIDVSLIKTIRNADGSEVSKEEINKFVNQKLGLTDENTGDMDINPDYLKAILAGMESVTQDSAGTAYVRFKDFGISVGGKTGSAEAGKDADGKDIVNAWFVGFAPFENPEIAIVVMVENGLHGNYTAEVARDIMEEYFGMNTSTVTEDMSATPYVGTY